MNAPATFNPRIEDEDEYTHRMETDLGDDWQHDLRQIRDDQRRRLGTTAVAGGLISLGFLVLGFLLVREVGDRTQDTRRIERLESTGEQQLTDIENLAGGLEVTREQLTDEGITPDVPSAAVISDTVRGDPGQIGLPGPRGDRGPPGASGAPGQQGDTGPSGPAGESGTTGAMGSPGGTGATGTSGDPGSPGSQGPAGIDGQPGTPGQQGAKGDQGDQGDPGVTGPTGPSPESFTFTFMGIEYTCTDTEPVDDNYTCTPT